MLNRIRLIKEDLRGVHEVIEASYRVFVTD
jgi:hypothetical protein